MESQLECPICYNVYDDKTHRCYTICEKEGHAICQDCLRDYKNDYKKCPICRGKVLDVPVFTRVFQSGPVPVTVQNTTSHASHELVLIVDVSGSMTDTSGDQDEAPTRLELAAHLAKVFHSFAKRLGAKTSIYTFSSIIERLDINTNTPLDTVNKVLEGLRPGGETRLGKVLEMTFKTHGPTAKYFVFTDGEPSDEYRPLLELFSSTQLHLIAFSRSTQVQVLKDVRTTPLHTISYVEDIRSLPGYMVPVFIYAMTDAKTVSLDPVDEECRLKYVEILEPQVTGSSSMYKLSDLVTMLKRYKTSYSRDLEDDTAGNKAHGRIEYSFQNNEWARFGRFYLQCIAHCHQHKIPGNSFDVSLRHYRTPEYKQLYDKIADVPMTIPFVPFMSSTYQSARASGNTQAQTQAAAASQKLVQQAFSYTNYADTCYSYSSPGDDGCIGPDADVHCQNGVVKMRDLVPGDRLASGSRVKWIIRVKNLYCGNPFPLYNGLTGSHPVKCGDVWMPAKCVPGAQVTLVNETVYDVILDDLSQDSMDVNSVKAAVVGYPVPGMVHPYWGSARAVDDVKSRLPDGGVIEVDAANFKYDAAGLVSSIF